MIKAIVQIVVIIICLALTALVLMQEGKQQGLGSIAGAADTYWGQNKGRSAEGKMVKWTKILAAAFFILALALNLKWFA